MSRGSRLVTAVAFAFLAAAAGPLMSGAAHAQTAPTPAPNPQITLVAQPMLGGVIAPGAWVAVRVDVSNAGPAVRGELRLAAASGGGSKYSIPVELASGARQQHFMYTQLGPFGSRFDVELRAGDALQASVRVSVTPADTERRRVFVVAERPETFTAALTDALTARGSPDPNITAVAPQDLPPRAEPWRSVELLVWHDLPFSSLDAGQLAALRTWVALGGDLIVVGGPTGIPTFTGFPAGLLPYEPSTVIDVPTTDLGTILGSLPAGATPLPALTGTLARGSAIWNSGGQPIAARSQFGQGSVALLGIDPSSSWLAGEPAATMWSAAVPTGAAWADATLPTDDTFLVNSLGELPAVQLPGGNELTLLILGYIIAIGPLNYIILKRRDRREWAWITMPLTIAVFGVAAYGFGLFIKGSNVIVNELAIVQGAVGADAGVADVHVGVFSPSRANFDVRVGPAALISPSSVTDRGDGTTGQRPLDILIGDPATVRSFGVGFGALRSFRAETAVAVPLIQADLRLTDAGLAGTITNASTTALEEVSFAYAGTGRIIGDLAAGDSREVSLDNVGGDRFGEPLSWQLYPFADAGGGGDRTTLVRRAMVQHLAGGWEEGMPDAQRNLFGRGPVILAWAESRLLDIDTGQTTERVGQTLYVLPLRVAISGHVVFGGGMLEATLESLDSAEGWKESGSYFLSRGTLTVEYRPVAFDGAFSVASLDVRMDADFDAPQLDEGGALAPLPAEEQPDPDSPLASNPRPDDGSRQAPRLQFFDRVAGTWVEFEPADLGQTYRIANPQNYVDASGAFRIRFVERHGDFLQFNVSARLEGNVQ